MRLVDLRCPALADFVREVGLRAASEHLLVGDISRSLTRHVARARAAATAVEMDAQNSTRYGARLLIPEDPMWPTGIAVGGTGVPGALGLWVRGRAGLKVLPLPSVFVSGARAASGYGIHVAGVRARTHRAGVAGVRGAK